MGSCICIGGGIYAKIRQFDLPPPNYYLIIL